MANVRRSRSICWNSLMNTASVRGSENIDDALTRPPEALRAFPPMGDERLRRGRASLTGPPSAPRAAGFALGSGPARSCEVVLRAVHQPHERVFEVAGAGLGDDGVGMALGEHPAV